jgi:hypothetical protein
VLLVGNLRAFASHIFPWDGNKSYACIFMPWARRWQLTLKGESLKARGTVCALYEGAIFHSKEHLSLFCLPEDGVPKEEAFNLDNIKVPGNSRSNGHWWIY